MSANVLKKCFFLRIDFLLLGGEGGIFSEYCNNMFVRNT